MSAVLGTCLSCGREYIRGIGESSRTRCGSCVRAAHPDAIDREIVRQLRRAAREREALAPITYHRKDGP